jgi:hypothetical protein
MLNSNTSESTEISAVGSACQTCYGGVCADGLYCWSPYVCQFSRIVLIQVNAHDLSDFTYSLNKNLKAYGNEHYATGIRTQK